LCWSQRSILRASYSYHWRWHFSFLCSWRPSSRSWKKWSFPRIVAISLVVLAVASAIGAMGWVISQQVISLTEQVPASRAATHQGDSTFRQASPRDFIQSLYSCRDLGERRPNYFRPSTGHSGLLNESVQFWTLACEAYPSFPHDSRICRKSGPLLSPASTNAKRCSKTGYANSIFAKLYRSACEFQSRLPRMAANDFAGRAITTWEERCHCGIVGFTVAYGLRNWSQTRAFCTRLGHLVLFSDRGPLQSEVRFQLEEQTEFGSDRRLSKRSARLPLL